MLANPVSPAQRMTSVGRVRWRICALLFWATTLNYIDRQVLGVLAPSLGHALGWTEVDYGYIVTAFQAAYAIGLVFAGAVIDRLGTRIGYALAIGIWGAAAASHALARTVLAFAACRFALGLGEAGNFPAAVKTVAEWFPRRERALATGIFNAGSNIGAVLAPIAVPVAVSLWGLRSGFLLTSVLSALWLVTWLSYYRAPQRHPAVCARELEHIRGESEAAGAVKSADGRSEEAQQRGPQQRVRWRHLLRHRQTWAFAAGKFLTDPVWWFLLFWLPKFLHHRYGLNLTGLGPPLVAIYVMADIGSVAGGWIAGRLMRMGWSANAARKGAMLLCALAVTPIVLAPRIHGMWGAVAIIGLATAAHQGWSANLLTTVSDLYPSTAVASVVGLGGFAGAVSGALVSTGVGYLLQATGSYALLFVIAGCMYVLALGVIHALVPRLEPAVLPSG
ncbi:MAG TPA: MFS transporter [Steroidobacteraceae bacterium]|nr:MFS transporter [Steroidobacteraceae bacterium]